MEIIGIGVDIEEVERFEKLPFESNQSFYQKIFTEREINYCLKKEKPFQCFAGKFSAKEAFIKAIDEKISDYKGVEVMGNENNKPKIKSESSKVFLSISHTENQAIAFLILVK